MAVKNYNVSEVRFQMLDPNFMYKITKDMTERHEKLEEQFADYGALAGTMEQYANEDPDSDCARMYKTFSDQLNEASETLARGGINALDRRKIMQLKSSYANNIAPIATAQERRSTAIKEFDAKRAADRSFIGIDPRSKKLDLYLHETPSFSGVSMDKVAAAVTASAALASKEVYSGPTIRNIGHGIIDISTTNGYDNNQQLQIMNTLKSGDKNRIAALYNDKNTAELARVYQQEQANAATLFPDNPELRQQYMARVDQSMFDGMTHEPDHKYMEDPMFKLSQANKAKSAATRTEYAGKVSSLATTFKKDELDKRFKHFGKVNENGEFIVDIDPKYLQATIGGKGYGKDFLTPSTRTKNAAHFRLKTKDEIFYNELSKANQEKYDNLYDFCVTAGISDPTKENIAFITRDGRGLKWHLTASINRDVVGSKYYVEPEQRGGGLDYGSAAQGSIAYTPDNTSNDLIVRRLNTLISQSELYEIGDYSRDNDGKLIINRGKKPVKNQISDKSHISQIYIIPNSSSNIVEMDDGRRFVVNDGFISHVTSTGEDLANAKKAYAQAYKMYKDAVKRKDVTAMQVWAIKCAEYFARIDNIGATMSGVIKTVDITGKSEDNVEAAIAASNYILQEQ